MHRHGHGTACTSSVYVRELRVACSPGTHRSKQPSAGAWAPSKPASRTTSGSLDPATVPSCGGGDLLPIDPIAGHLPAKVSRKGPAVDSVAGSPALAISAPMPRPDRPSGVLCPRAAPVNLGA